MTHNTPAPPNARCVRCGALLYRHSMAHPDPTRAEQAIAALPHRGCGGQVVPTQHGEQGNEH
jgi:hypothetical protein